MDFGPEIANELLLPVPVSALSARQTSARTFDTGSEDERQTYAFRFCCFRFAGSLEALGLSLMAASSSGSGSSEVGEKAMAFDVDGTVVGNG